MGVGRPGVLTPAIVVAAGEGWAVVGAATRSSPDEQATRKQTRPPARYLQSCFMPLCSATFRPPTAVSQSALNANSVAYERRCSLWLGYRDSNPNYLIQSPESALLGSFGIVRSERESSILSGFFGTWLSGFVRSLLVPL